MHNQRQRNKTSLSLSLLFNIVLNMRVKIARNDDPPQDNEKGKQKDRGKRADEFTAQYRQMKE